MVDSVEQILLAIAPEFSHLDNSVIINMAQRSVAIGFCGDRRNDLVAWLAAHMIDISQKYAGSSGSISSVKEGGADISYGDSKNVSDGSAGLSSSTYGRRYLEMLKSCDIPLRTRVCDVSNYC
jgi:hypothetical protein